MDVCEVRSCMKCFSNIAMPTWFSAVSRRQSSKTWTLSILSSFFALSVEQVCSWQHILRRDVFGVSLAVSSLTCAPFAWLGKGQKKRPKAGQLEASAKAHPESAARGSHWCLDCKGSAFFKCQHSKCETYP